MFLLWMRIVQHGGINAVSACTLPSVAYCRHQLPVWEVLNSCAQSHGAGCLQVALQALLRPMDFWHVAPSLKQILSCVKVVQVAANKRVVTCAGECCNSVE